MNCLYFDLDFQSREGQTLSFSPVVPMCGSIPGPNYITSCSFFGMISILSSMMNDVESL